MVGRASRVVRFTLCDTGDPGSLPGVVQITGLFTPIIFLSLHCWSATAAPAVGSLPLKD